MMIEWYPTLPVGLHTTDMGRTEEFDQVGHKQLTLE